MIEMVYKPYGVRIRGRVYQLQAGHAKLLEMLIQGKAITPETTGYKYNALSVMICAVRQFLKTFDLPYEILKEFGQDGAWTLHKKGTDNANGHSAAEHQKDIHS